MLKFSKNNFIYLLLIIALTSCISRVNKHGYMFDLSDHEQLKAEISTKDFVLRVMGSPTIINDLDDEETWIYLSQDVKNLLFFKPKVVDRTIIAIKFNNDVVKNLEYYNLQDQSQLHFATNHTEVSSNKVGFFKSIFSNIGQVRAQ